MDFISKRIHGNNSIFEFKINVQKEDKNIVMEFKETGDDFKEVINNINKFTDFKHLDKYKFYKRICF